MCIHFLLFPCKQILSKNQKKSATLVKAVATFAICSVGPFLLQKGVGDAVRDLLLPPLSYCPEKQKKWSDPDVGRIQGRTNNNAFSRQRVLMYPELFSTRQTSI